MIPQKNIRFYYCGIILSSSIALLISFGLIEDSFPLDFWAPMILPFLIVYSLLFFIKNRVIKAILIIPELLWTLFVPTIVFLLEDYDFGEYIPELILLIINIFLRLLVLFNLFTFKNKKVLLIILSILIPVLIYSYGTTDYLSVGF